MIYTNNDIKIKARAFLKNETETKKKRVVNLAYNATKNNFKGKERIYFFYRAISIYFEKGLV